MNSFCAVAGWNSDTPSSRAVDALEIARSRLFFSCNPMRKPEAIAGYFSGVYGTPVSIACFSPR